MNATQKCYAVIGRIPDDEDYCFTYRNTYDGSTWPCVIPRHPVDTTPGMPGGG